MQAHLHAKSIIKTAQLTMGEPKHAQPHSPAEAIRGDFYHTPQYGSLEALRDSIIVLHDGKIVKVAAGSEELAICEEFSLRAVRRLKVCYAAPFDRRFFPPYPASFMPRSHHHAFVCRQDNSSFLASLIPTSMHPKYVLKQPVN